MDIKPSTAPRSAAGIAIRIGVVVLTLMAALVHLSLLFPDPVFIVNGIGYLALLAALYLPVPRLVPYRRAVQRAVGTETLPHDGCPKCRRKTIPTTFETLTAR